MVLAAVQLLGSGPLMPTSGATKHLKERDGHSTGSPPNTHTPLECRRIPLTFPLIIRLAGSQLPVINHVLPLDLQTGTAAIY